MILNWLKGFGWVKTAGAIVATVALALLAGKVRNRKKRIAKNERTATDLLNSGISSKIQKGKKLLESADKDKDAVIDIHKRMEARVEQLGQSSEDIDSIADRFNSKRSRLRK